MYRKDTFMQNPHPVPPKKLKLTENQREAIWDKRNIKRNETISLSMRRGKLIENGEQGINLKDFEESAAFFRKYKEKWITELKCLIKDYQKSLFHNDNGSAMITTKQSSMKDPVA